MPEHYSATGSPHEMRNSGRHLRLQEGFPYLTDHLCGPYRSLDAYTLAQAAADGAASPTRALCVIHDAAQLPVCDGIARVA